MLNALRNMYHIARRYVLCLIRNFLFSLSTDDIENLVAIRVGMPFVAFPRFEFHNTGTKPFTTGDIGRAHPFENAPIKRQALNVVGFDKVF
jgi:hypothetical protein